MGFSPIQLGLHHLTSTFQPLTGETLQSVHPNALLYFFYSKETPVLRQLL
ncbi:MAG: hypothetical protein Q6K55_01400 [Thermostichus sp. DG02_3_bins_51]